MGHGLEDPMAAESTPEAMTLTLPQATAAAVQLLGQRRLPQAEALLQAVIEAEPANADALHFMGLLRAQQGRGDEAIDLIRQALAVDPRYADAWNNFGLLLRAMPRDSAALEAFDKAAEYAPQLISAHLNRAQLLRKCGRFDEAVAAFRRVLELDPANTDAHHALGNLLYRAGRQEEAAQAYAGWHDVEPHNPVAAHLAAANHVGTAPARASDDYVRATFDRFAPGFDRNMAALRYRAPELVLEEVEKYHVPARALDVLDAGCGTGLCGPKLAPYARRLVGVDLSPAMVALATRRGGYDDLVAAELTAYLEAQTGQFDLIVSADTLVYFGSLDEVLTAAAGALRESGHMIFTVERLDENVTDGHAANGFFLNPHGRYSHAEKYLRQSANAAGFEVCSLRTETLRFENDVPVVGFVLTAGKL